MAISSIVCRGFGSFGGGVANVPTRGYGIGVETGGGGDAGIPFYFSEDKKRTPRPIERLKPVEKYKPPEYQTRTLTHRGTIGLPSFTLAGAGSFTHAEQQFQHAARLAQPRFELVAKVEFLRNRDDKDFELLNKWGML